MPLLTSLDAISDFAGLAVAVALAYAALPNFRYRIRVQDYVRDRLRAEDGLLIAVKTDAEQSGTICCDSNWGILYRLGRLKDLNGDIKPPEVPVEKSEPLQVVDLDTDNHFLNTKHNLLFTWMYSSNLDKIISIALGGITGAVIWFAAIDQIMYPEITSRIVDNRLQYLSGVVWFINLNLLVLFLSIILHRRLWEPDLPSKSWKRILIRFIYWLCILFFGVTLVFATFGYLRVPSSLLDLVVQYDRAVIFSEILGASLVTIALPVIFLAKGQELTSKIESEVDKAIARVKGLIAKNASRAQLKRPNAAEDNIIVMPPQIAPEALD